MLPLRHFAGRLLFYVHRVLADISDRGRWEKREYLRPTACKETLACLTVGHVLSTRDGVALIRVVCICVRAGKGFVSKSRQTYLGLVLCSNYVVDRFGTCLLQGIKLDSIIAPIFLQRKHHFRFQIHFNALPVTGEKSMHRIIVQFSIPTLRKAIATSLYAALSICSSADHVDVGL